VKPTDLRGILQYIPRFRDKTFVVSVDGAVVEDVNFANLLLDIAVLRSLNIGVVLVHGAAGQIKKLATEKGITPSNLDGTGVTDDATLQLGLAAANRLTHEVLEGFATNDLRAANANALIVHPMGIVEGIDQQHTGRVERVDTELLQTLLSQGITPVIPPLGFDGEGNTFRVNSDAAALALASALHATKLIFVTTEDGLMRDGKLIHQVTAGDLEELLLNAPNSLLPAQISKARHAALANTAGIERVHIINGRVTEGLLAEVFSNEGIGTLVYANEYRQIRPARKKDIGVILKLNREAVENDELVHRGRADLELHLDDYYLYEIDNHPVACAALHRYPAEAKGELAHLYVSPSHTAQGIGRKLIQFIEKISREEKLDSLITLSTRAFAYFKTKAGFSEGSLGDLPAERLEDYESNGRNSKILIKHLSLSD